MTLVLIIKGLVFEGPTPKTKDKWVPGMYIVIQLFPCSMILKALCDACAIAQAKTMPFPVQTL